MGIMPLVWLKQAQDELERQNRNNNKKEKLEEDTYTPFHDCYDYYMEYTYLNDAFFNGFFDKLLTEFKKAIKEYNSQFEDEYKKLTETLKIFRIFYFMDIRVKDSYMIDKEKPIGIYLYYNHRYNSLFFDVDEITKDNPIYQNNLKMLRNWQSNLKIVEKREVELKKKIKREIRPKRKKQLENQLVSTIKTIKQYKEDIENAQRCIKKYERIVNLTPEEKDMLITLINTPGYEKEWKKQEEKIWEDMIHMFTYTNFDKNYKALELFESVLIDMIEKGVITIDEIKQIISIMDDIKEKAKNKNIKIKHHNLNKNELYWIIKVFEIVIIKNQNIKYEDEDNNKKEKNK